VNNIIIIIDIPTYYVIIITFGVTQRRKPKQLYSVFYAVAVYSTTD
jgi:hypothetical protein